MATDIIVPPLGESVTEATVARWLKQPGDAVVVDDPLVELETDKVTLEVNAPAAGTLAEVLVPKDGNVAVGGVLGRIAEGNGKGKPATKAESKPVPAAPPPKAAAPKAPAADLAKRSGPAVRRLVDENKVEPARIPPSGRDGRLTKGDVLAALENGTAPAPATAPAVARETGAREERV
ncbi:MAG: biotin/lipoyl-containing protein, partial [Stellaceae bacterium]